MGGRAAPRGRRLHHGDTLTEMVETMHRNWFATLRPATRAAYIEYRRLERIDCGEPFAWMDEPGLDRDAEGKLLEAQYAEQFSKENDKRPGIWKVIEAEGAGEQDVDTAEERTCPSCGRLKDVW